MGTSVTLLLGMQLLCVLGQQIHVVVYNSLVDMGGGYQTLQGKNCEEREIRLTSVTFPVVCINFGEDIWKAWLQEC